MSIFTQWSSSVPSYLLYKKRDTILLQPLYSLKVADIFVIPEFRDGLRLFCPLFIIHLDTIIYHQSISRGFVVL